MRKIIFFLFLGILNISILSSCSLSKLKNKDFAESGTIIISHQIPLKESSLAISSLNAEEKLFSPLIGYFPPTLSYLPAENETWLEINKQESKVSLYKGTVIIKEMKAEGLANLPTGDYFLQRKQKEPLWYAPDNYFTSRQIKVPSPDDKLRYRKGALGKFALFPTTSFPIHCAPLWSEDVGGLKVAPTDLASIYYMIQVGAPVVVK